MPGTHTKKKPRQRRHLEEARHNLRVKIAQPYVGERTQLDQPEQKAISQPLVGGTAHDNPAAITAAPPTPNDLSNIKSIRELYAREERALNEFLLALLRIQKELKRTNASVSPELHQLIDAEQIRWNAFDQRAIELLQISNNKEAAEKLRTNTREYDPANNVKSFVRVLFTPLKPRKILEPVGTIGDFIQHQKAQRIAAIRARRRQR